MIIHFMKFTLLPEKMHKIFKGVNKPTLREKCPNAQFFLLFLRSKSPHSVQLREYTDKKKLCIWELFMQLTLS